MSVEISKEAFSLPWPTAAQKRLSGQNPLLRTGERSAPSDPATWKKLRSILELPSRKQSQSAFPNFCCHRSCRLFRRRASNSGGIRALQPLWEAMGKTIVHQGGAGTGQHTKMVNQILIATGMIGVCEALLYGQQAGLDLPTVLKSVSSGAAGSWSLSNLGPRVIDNNFDPGFFVEHFIKDMGIALEESRRMGLSMPGLALAQQLYLTVKSQGFGRNGTHALMLALSQLSGVDWRKRQ